LAQGIDPIYQFELKTLAGPWNIAGHEISFTNSSLFMAVAVGLITLFLVFAASRAALVPGRVQAVGELWYEFVHNLVKSVLGPEGKPFFPLVFSLFSFVLILNLLGMFPYFFTVTSHMVITASLAVFVVAMVVVVGIYKHGLSWFKLFVPPGVPIVILPLISLIEIISFLSRPVSLGLRLFGNRDNNRVQYNLAAFWRLEKDTNSGLNAILRTPRQDFVLVANLYRQDLPVPGMTSQVSVTWNANRERDDVQVDANGFPVRPALVGTLRGRAYDVVYLGYNADGHIGRLNLTLSATHATGSNRGNIFTDRRAKISSWFVAFEPSYDRGWARFRGSALFASGDSDPFDDVDRGYAAIFENPQFAGADTSYWIRQTIPFAGGGRAVAINGRNGILNDLRPSKEQGQANFTNPGTLLLGGGADFDLLPELRVSGNLNHLWFATTAVLQALRMEGSIPRDIGWDLSAAATYRPHFNQNLVFRMSGALLKPGDGFRDLFTNAPRTGSYYSVLFNAVLAY
jgi:ATP synthase subunit 6